MGRRKMTSIETLKVFDGGFRLLAMAEGGRLCILDLDQPLPSGYKVGMVELPDEDVTGIFDTPPGESFDVPVISVRLSISAAQGMKSCPLAFSQ